MHWRYVCLRTNYGTAVTWAELDHRLSPQNTPITSPSGESYVFCEDFEDHWLHYIRFISWCNSGFRAWTSNYVHKKLRYVIISPCLESNGGLVKSRLKLGSEWMIASLSKNYRTYPCHIISKQYVIKETLSVINSKLGLKNRKYLAAFLKNLVLQRCAFFMKFMAQVGIFVLCCWWQFALPWPLFWSIYYFQCILVYSEGRNIISIAKILPCTISFYVYNMYFHD